MRRTLPPAIVLGLGIVLALGCAASGCRHAGADREEEPGEGPGSPWFEDVTEQVGLDFVHDAGPTGHYFLPQIVGSGAALFDFDGTGRLGIYLVQNGGPPSHSTNRLYRQREDGRFEDVSAGSGLDVAGYGMGVAVGDVNNDGRPDVLLTEFGGCRLFMNEGDGHFTEVTARLGSGSLTWATSACFFDYDRDGWLDLVVTNYVDYDPSWTCTGAGGQPDFCHPDVFPGSATRLYRNLGRDAKGNWRGFRDVTPQAGLDRARGPGLGVVCADFDGDGWPDIFVANDGKPNRLWINRHDGTFKEEALVRGVAVNGQAQAQANMGIALGDIDGDGLFDLYVTHLTEEGNVLWQQGPRGAFQDRTAAADLNGTRRRGTGFGTVFGDFDRDGALDLAVANGRVYRRSDAEPGAQGDFWERYAERNQLLSSDGTGQFHEISGHTPAFCSRRGVYRGLAVADVFNTGALDLLVTEVAGRARLFRNVAPEKGHWLEVSAVDPACGGRDAHGAIVTVWAGQRRWKRWLNPAGSYLCSSDPRAHFGLGTADRVDAIQVRWPDNTLEAFRGTPADRLLRLEKGRGVAVHP